MTATRHKGPAAAGTTRGYTTGCRCRRCREAWATYQRAYKHRTGRARTREDAQVAAEVHAAEASARRAVRTGLRVAVPMDLSPLGLQILLAAQRRTRRRRGQVFDTLLRRYGRELDIMPDGPEAAPVTH